MDNNITNLKTVDRIVGLDLSLNKAGVSTFCPNGHKHYTITQPDMKLNVRTRPQIERIGWMARQASNVARGIGEAPPFETLVVIEGLSAGANESSHAEVVGVHFMVLYTLFVKQIQYVQVAPNSLKKFAIGKGVGTKSDVKMWVTSPERDFGVSAEDVKTDDEADAIVLDHIGRCLAMMKDPKFKFQKEVIEAILNPPAKKPRKRKTAAK